MINIDWNKAFLVFIAYIILDALYAKYSMEIQKRRAYHAGVYGALMYCLLAFGVIIYTTDPIYIIFVGLGSFVGTVFAIKYLDK